MTEVGQRERNRKSVCGSWGVTRVCVCELF